MARDFDGSNDKAQYTSDSSQNTLGAISVSMMLNADNFTSGTNAPRLIHKGPNARGYFEVVADGSTTPKRLGFGRDYVTQDCTNFFNAPSLATWTNVVFTHSDDDTGLNIIGYYDGVAQSSVTSANGTGGRTADSTQLSIGNRGTDNIRPFDGRLAEVAIWNRVLTAAEAAALGKGFSPLFFRRGLVFYVPLYGNLSTEPGLKTQITATLTDTTKADHPRIIYPSDSFLRRFAIDGADAAAALQTIFGDGLFS